eukprot:5553664-Amphidinium_carterae.1
MWKVTCSPSGAQMHELQPLGIFRQSKHLWSGAIPWQRSNKTEPWTRSRLGARVAAEQDGVRPSLTMTMTTGD